MCTGGSLARRVFDGGDLDKAAAKIIGSNGSSNEKENMSCPRLVYHAAVHDTENNIVESCRILNLKPMIHLFVVVKSPNLSCQKAFSFHIYVDTQ